MSRPLRFQYPGAMYHVMNRGANREPIFFEAESDRRVFLAVLGDVVAKRKIDVHVFALMPNHYHLLVETPFGNLSDAMKHLDSVYTQRFNKIHGRDGPLFRGRFKSILVQEERYFLELVRYIHLNGVRAGLVRRPGDDVTTSHHCYLRRNARLKWLRRDKVMRYFLDRGLFSVDKFQQFIGQPLDTDFEKSMAQKRWPAILGSKSFVQEIKERFALDAPSDNEEDMPQRKEVRLAHLVHPEKITKIVLDTYGQTAVEELKGEAKWALIHFLKNDAQQTNRQVAALFGNVTEAAVRMYWTRASFEGTRRIERIKSELREMFDVRT